MSNDTIDATEAGCEYINGADLFFRIDPVGTKGVFDTTEALAWQAAGPHATLAASTDFAIKIFDGVGEAEQVAAEALRDVWNRILARNMARAEGTSQLMLSAGREALGHFEDAQCQMAMVSIGALDTPNFNVQDGQ